MRGHVYVVDDDARFRDSLAALVASVGFDFEAISDPGALLSKTELKRPGCIVLDYRMPTLSGMQVLKLIRESSSIPVIMVSGYADVRTVVGAMTAGAVAVFEKPLDDNEILEFLEQACFRDRETVRAGKKCALIQARLATLTLAERAVLDLMVRCRETKEIAYDLGRSIKSIERSRGTLVSKLGCRTFSELFLTVTRCPLTSASPIDCGGSLHTCADRGCGSSRSTATRASPITRSLSPSRYSDRQSTSTRD